MTQVTLLAGDFPPMTGGISSFMYEMVRRLPPRDVSVIGLPTPGWEAFDAKQEFAVIRLKVPSAWSAFSSQYKFLAPYYYRALIKQRDLACVLCDAAHHTTMLPAWLLKTARGIPFGVFAHGEDLLHRQRRTIYKPALNLLIRSADAVFVNSRRTGGIARDIVGVEPNRIHEIHPPVNLGLRKNASPETIRRALGLQDKKCVLTVGQLLEHKGHDIVLRALPRVIQQVPNLHYIIVGRGGRKDHLKKLAQSLDVEAYVTFADDVSNDDLGSYYALCDLFVMISREIPEKGDIEGFGIVYLEANLFGKPVIAGCSGGTPDAVLDGQTGLLVDPVDPAAVADAMLRVLLDAEFAKRLGETGRARVIEYFSGNTLAQDILTVMTRRST